VRALTELDQGDQHLFTDDVEELLRGLARDRMDGLQDFQDGPAPLKHGSLGSVDA